MKYITRSLLVVFLLLIFTSGMQAAEAYDPYPMELTEQEKVWLENNKNRDFVLGLDPFSGMDYFVHQGEEKGYLLKLAKAFEKDLGISITVEGTKSWGEVLRGLKDGEVDILFGANETPERREYMSFTKPVQRYPYAVIAKKSSSIYTLGDIDSKRVGFIESDMIIDTLPKLYKNLRYSKIIYYSQEEGVEALNKGHIDALVISGGAVVHDFIYQNPQLKYAAKINGITSDMTLSTRKEDEILARILDREIDYLHKTGLLPEIIRQAEIDYNRRIMKLTEKELLWLEQAGTAVVGITKDYLPFDYYKDGEYKGISGQIINNISRITGITFTYKYGDFDELYEALKRGEIDILNIAKTTDRTQYFHFPQPYSTERDIIIGRKDREDARDIFGLEGKRIAVVTGFWHKELLEKNLQHVDIIETKNLQESFKLVHEGNADYLIENPTVARYYIEYFQVYDLVEKGVTSTDSYLYYGIAKNQFELAGIIDKAIPLLDIDECFKKGYEEVPRSKKEESAGKLMTIIAGLAILLAGIILYVIRLIRALLKEKTEKELLRQREHFLYTDAVTGLLNRNYFNGKIKDVIDRWSYPQTAIICDMNNLKVVNDQYGHHMGDQLLKHLGDMIKTTCPEGCMVLRMGGDEFLVILKGSGEEEAERIVEEIRDRINRNSMTAENQEKLYAKAAFGYAVRYSPEVSFDDILRDADRMMYQNKRMEKSS